MTRREFDHFNYCKYRTPFALDGKYYVGDILFKIDSHKFIEGDTWSNGYTEAKIEVVAYGMYTDKSNPNIPRIGQRINVPGSQLTAVSDQAANKRWKLDESKNVDASEDPESIELNPLILLI